MKKLNEYVNALDQSRVPVTESDAMRKLKKYAQVDIDGNEGLYETTDDRWSRNAKHHMSKSELTNPPDTVDFEVGESAIYEGNTVEVKIPRGPKGTTGIMVEGHLKMVPHSHLLKLDEGVLGGVMSMNPINRIMQLAGLEHSGTVLPEVEETITVDSDARITEEQDVLTEAGTTNTLNQLITLTMNTARFKGNEEAARLQVYGELMAAIYNDYENRPMQTEQGKSKERFLKSVGPVSADFIKTATSMTGSAPAAKGTASTTPTIK